MVNRYAAKIEKGYEKSRSLAETASIIAPCRIVKDTALFILSFA